MSSRRNEIAHLNRRNRREGRAARRAGITPTTGVPLFAAVIRAAILADQQKRTEERRCRRMDDQTLATTYRPVL